MAGNSICRGCAGTGIDAEVPPRAVQLLELPIQMRNDAGSLFVAHVSERLEVGRLRFSGPLILLIERVEQRLKDGYQIVDGDVPYRALACQWCNGYGCDEGQLTVHTLEQLHKSSS